MARCFSLVVFAVAASVPGAGAGAGGCLVGERITIELRLDPKLGTSADLECRTGKVCF